MKNKPLFYNYFIKPPVRKVKLGRGSILKYKRHFFLVGYISKPISILFDSSSIGLKDEIL